jgi:hypothetical protein
MDNPAYAPFKAASEAIRGDDNTIEIPYNKDDYANEMMMASIATEVANNVIKDLGEDFEEMKALVRHYSYSSGLEYFTLYLTMGDGPRWVDSRFDEVFVVMGEDPDIAIVEKALALIESPPHSSHKKLYRR